MTEKMTAGVSQELAPWAWYRGDPEYPGALLDLRNPPDCLYALGARAMLDAPCVAIVGTRDSTSYGERAARRLATAVARAGGCVISGMARGIDSTAHRAALECGGRTVAVLGTGVDVPYPGGHRRLHALIADRGLVISEFPPGTTAFKGCFPRRNRIIAALARVTVVVEAGHKSGALLTAKDALELGRAVAAVPGPIDSPESDGANQLLRDGAHVIATPDDLLALAGLAPGAEPQLPVLSPGERAVWDALGRGAAQMDLLVERSKLPLKDCLAATSSLEMHGLIAAGYAGDFRRL